MKKFYQAIIKARVPILIGFIIATVLCLGLRNLVGVDYDINDYLPDDASSTQSIDLMSEEFAEGIPNARVMIKSVSIPEALDYKSRLKEIDGVEDVTWLDDSVDLTIPLDTLDQSAVETYYKDGSALYSVTIADEKAVSAVEEIRALIGEDNALSGNVVNTADGTTKTVGEIQIITAITIAFALLVLILSTDSWLEPLVVLAGLGVAIVINSGTNLIFGTISFVTNAAGSVLQLAVSLDYSVFLIHCFAKHYKGKGDPKKAMVRALTESTGSILSSGLTTVIGFLALVLMRFKLGPDLGLALAKGVAISLLTTFIFMPALILITHKWLEKTHHKSFLPSFKGFGKAVSRITLPLVTLFTVAVIPAYLAYNHNSYYYGSSHLFTTESRIGRDTAAIEDTFGQKDTYALLVPTGQTATELAMSNELKQLDEVTDIISYVDTVGNTIPTSYLDQDTLKKLDSGKHRRFVLSVAVPYEGDETFSLVEKVRDIANKYYPDDYYLAGQGVSTYDLKDTVTSDSTTINLISIGAVFLVLALSLKSVILPAVLVFAIEAAIFFNLAVPYFSSEPIFYIAYLIISSIQLGATVDYAILFTDHYRDNRKTLDKKPAIVKTISDVTSSILVSGSVLTIVGFLLGLFSSNQLLAQLGIFIGRGALFSLAIVVFVLPGLLYIFDRFATRANSKSTN